MQHAGGARLAPMSRTMPGWLREAWTSSSVSIACRAAAEVSRRVFTATGSSFHVAEVTVPMPPDPSTCAQGRLRECAGKV